MKVPFSSAAVLAGLLAVAAYARVTFAPKVSVHPAIFNTPREIHITAPNGHMNSVRLVSWNIDRGTRINAVVEDLKRYPADLCLFQEVDWGTARTHGADIAGELAHRLHLNAAYGVEFEELGQERGRPAYIGQATLTKLPIEKVRILRFRKQSGWWKPRAWIPTDLPFMQRRMGDRMALVTELRFDRHLLVVYNVHLESRSLGMIQYAQLDEILADVNRYSAGTAVIVGGDLNTKYFPSKFLKKMEDSGFRSALGQHIERTHKIAMALDWIFARGPVKIEDGEVVKETNASDHFPVYAELVAQ